ncbi:MAG: Adenylate/guanylate cyclase [Verrucomicrobiales bacterium]|nr:Adenylate/guanylate cyclase [Verrucomicrobiales bacterium]
MQLKPGKFFPLLVCGLAIGMVCLVQELTRHFASFNFFQRLEWMTYDWRVREAQKYPATNAQNLGIAFVSDETIAALIEGKVAGQPLDYRAGLYWPRHVYGRLVQELNAQHAKAIAFDVLFGELRPDHPNVLLPDLNEESSDHFLARSMQEAGNVALGSKKGVLPPVLFRTNAWKLGDIGVKRDTDGILRRAKAYDEYYIWHPLIQNAGQLWDLDLKQPKIEEHRILFASGDKKRKSIPLDSDGNFDQVELYKKLTQQDPPAKVRPIQKPYTLVRAWNLGIVMAARELGLDLDAAQIQKRHIILRGLNGVERVIPIDAENRFYIDWNFTPFDPRITRESIEYLLLQEHDRRIGKIEGLTNRWENKLVLVGSTASGNDLTDLGATPLEKETYLTAGILNTANSLIVGRFIQRPSHGMELLLIIIMGLVTWPLTWNFRAMWATFGMLVLAGVYFYLGHYFFVTERLWMPMVMPITSLLCSHISLLTYEAFFEQKEKRRIKTVFAKIVSPGVVHELLTAPKLSLAGTRREVTVFFADIRGFTELTDLSQANAEKYVREHQLAGAEAEKYFNARSQELLQTINLYLGLIAETIKKHDGTLDKYMGDCVMAFWGAPAPLQEHAVCCVRAAVEAQRAIYRLNLERAEENKRLEQENAIRLSRGEKTFPLLKLLSLGTGINTGVVTVGLMGSDAHIVNYTVLGREVNLASRLEKLSGRGRILIGEMTYQMLLKGDPALAACCVEQPATSLQGFSAALKIYEVPWKEPKASPAEGATGLIKVDSKAPAVAGST